MPSGLGARRALVLVFACSVAGCSSGGSPGVLPPGPGNGGAPSAPSTAAPSPTPVFDPASVQMREYRVPTSPQYVAAAPDASVYFGNGGNGSGSNLYTFAHGAFRQTVPADPPRGYGAGGGVYGITATSSQVYWLSAYSGPAFAPAIDVECGGKGRASLCEPTVDEPTSMLLDAHGVFWVGGLTFNGGGALATSTGARAQIASGVVQLVLGPGGAIWGALENYPTYSIAEFALSGDRIVMVRQFGLPPGDALGSITYGGDEALWFTDQQRNAIGRMDARGTLTEYPLRAAHALGEPWYGLWQITTACDGSVWFTEPTADAVARIDAGGTVHEFLVPSADAYPDAISAVLSTPCTNPNLWFGEQRSNRLGEVTY